MLREIIVIDEERCDGCGLCVTACAEGALAIVDGKAKLVSDTYCDGLGACLPVCPQDALSFEMREALAFDAEKVEQHLEWQAQQPQSCPGPQPKAQTAKSIQWPLQLALVSPEVSFLKGADLLLAADCAAYAHIGFNQEFMTGHVTLIACPKLDAYDLRAKLSAVFSAGKPQSLTIVRMEVPCCGGLERVTFAALNDIGNKLPVRVVTLALSGDILADSAK
jgi:Pyruvate/2-oxoacid:ferredoxin oxidoreductase delta subunit